MEEVNSSILPIPDINFRTGAIIINSDLPIRKVRASVLSNGIHQPNSYLLSNIENNALFRHTIIKAHKIIFMILVYLKCISATHSKNLIWGLILNSQFFYLLSCFSLVLEVCFIELHEVQLTQGNLIENPFSAYVPFKSLFLILFRYSLCHISEID